MANSVNLPALRAALLGTIAKVADKSFDRDFLTDGDSHSINATVEGTVDGRAFSFPIDATLTVGHETTRNVKSMPNAKNVLALVLDLVAKKHGAEATTTILNSIGKAYAIDGDIAASETHLKVVDSLFESMTTTSPTPVRGNVNVANATKTLEVRISNRKVS